jgi:uncharacterized membrane protein
VSDAYFWLKAVHILSAAVLFGTGLGTAFHMWLAHRSGDVKVIATVAQNVVLADLLFTTPAVVIQPATGAALIWLSSIDPLASWLIAAYGLYVLAGICWLPVLWLQIRARDLARAALRGGTALPPTYHRLMRLWFALGWPAFIAVIVIFWLMTAKPELW